MWPFVAVTSVLQLTYFVFLSAAYRRAELSVVYPVARGLAPVLVLLIGVVALGAGVGAAEAFGVCLVGLGVLLVRGLGGRRESEGILFGVAVASCIAAYTLVDKRGVEYASPVVYLELGMAPATLGYLVLLLTRPHGGRRLRAAVRPAPAAAGLLSYGAYALVLAALLRAPAAPVAACARRASSSPPALAAPVLLGSASARCAWPARGRGARRGADRARGPRDGGCGDRGFSGSSSHVAGPHGTIRRWRVKTKPAPPADQPRALLARFQRARVLELAADPDAAAARAGPVLLRSSPRIWTSSSWSGWPACSSRPTSGLGVRSADGRTPQPALADIRERVRRADAAAVAAVVARAPAGAGRAEGIEIVRDRGVLASRARTSCARSSSARSTRC